MSSKLQINQLGAWRNVLEFEHYPTIARIEEIIRAAMPLAMAMPHTSGEDVKAHHVCLVCGSGFHTDLFGRRERDWVKNDKYCDIFCNLAHTDMTEGRSITDAVMMFGNAKVAARRVRNVFDAQEFESALKARAAVEAKRLGHNGQGEALLNAGEVH